MFFWISVGKPKSPRKTKKSKSFGPLKKVLDFWIFGSLRALEPIQRAACLIGNGFVVRAPATDLVPESQSDAKLLRGRTIDLRFEPIPAQPLHTQNLIFVLGMCVSISTCFVLMLILILILILVASTRVVV